ncbi:MAG: ABC transporter permease [bacterium]|nr:ABC transporter permease [bacterium]
MLIYYLTLAARKLWREKLYAIINLFGLSLGLACCVIASSIIYHEYQFDRFHLGAEQTYRVLRERASNNQSQVRWLTSGALARTLEEEIPEIDLASKNRLYDVSVRTEQRSQILRQGHVDDQFFKLFNFPLVQGDLASLGEPYHIAITQRAAHRLFGLSDPLGKVLVIQERYYGGSYTISAVLKDPPPTSSIQFDLLHQTPGRTQEAQFDWDGWQSLVQQAGIETYVRLRPGVDPLVLEEKLSGIIARHMGEDVRRILRYRLQPLLRLHLHSMRDYGLATGGSIDTLYLFAAIALLILGIAAVNFINLSTAQALGRAREMALRKVAGAQRWQLISQLLTESTVISILALALAVPIARIFLTQLNDLFYTRYDLGFHEFLALAPFFFSIGLIFGLIGGLYPALYLSAFNPARSTGSFNHSGRFRQFLVVCQFTITVVLIVSTMVVDQQLRFIQNKNLGFDQNQLIVLPIFSADRESKTNNEPWLAARYNTVKQAFLVQASVEAASAFRFLPGKDPWFTRIVKPEGQDNTEWRMPIQETDEDLFATLGVPLLAGRTFSPENERDRTHNYILNKSAVMALGWSVENAVGRRFGRARSDDDAEGTVIGVVDDFHYASLRTPIAPAAFAYRQWFYNYLILRVRDLDGTLPFLEQTWTQFMPPELPFTYSLLSDELSALYQSERDLQDLVISFSVLSLLLACLGLFGLAAFTTERRTREIGIRKVLGASTPNILMIMSTNFLKLVMLANLVACPVGYYLTRYWLQNFAYRITPSIWDFLWAGVLTLAISCLTIGYHAARAAHTDPAKTLRHA